MKMRIEVECSPEEARRFMGLPDVTALNDQLVDEMGKRLQANMAMMAPDALMRSWMTMGGQAQEAVMNLLTASTSGMRSKGE